MDMNYSKQAVDGAKFDNGRYILAEVMAVLMK